MNAIFYRNRASLLRLEGRGSSVIKSPKIWNAIKDMLGYCPYCMAGKQVTSKISGKNQPTKPPSDNEKRFLEGIRTGRNIALVGVFCPIFWTSLFMGAEKSVLLFNAAHSGIFICIGGALSLFNIIRLRRFRQEIEVKKNSALLGKKMVDSANFIGK
ncbi:hypothetical protein [Desulfosporosinus shakirovi]|uniref:hypothetical protein n=1 Tax=Desulfosporosinus shakirovi TaxID=2885154 RepID=UPI001E40303F|nr:hypothetical protein [Desulfosporosinus sp. SRJS8]MCB8816682.1 hypothetical protein [Desulfosporosinus sp. SRJS8]